MQQPPKLPLYKYNQLNPIYAHRKIKTLLPLLISVPTTQTSSKRSKTREKCACLTFGKENRRNLEDNKHLALVLSVEAKLQPWMLRFNPSSVSYPCVFKSRENILVLFVLDAQKFCMRMLNLFLLINVVQDYVDVCYYGYNMYNVVNLYRKIGPIFSTFESNQIKGNCRSRKRLLIFDMHFDVGS